MIFQLYQKKFSHLVRAAARGLFTLRLCPTSSRMCHVWPRDLDLDTCLVDKGGIGVDMGNWLSLVLIEYPQTAIACGSQHPSCISDFPFVCILLCYVVACTSGFLRMSRSFRALECIKSHPPCVLSALLLSTFTVSVCQHALRRIVATTTAQKGCLSVRACMADFFCFRPSNLLTLS